MKLGKNNKQIETSAETDQELRPAEGPDESGITVDPELEVVELVPKKKDPAKARKKKKIVRRCIIGGVLVVIIVLIIYGNVTAKNAVPMVGVADLTMGDVEETISSSGFITSEKTKTYFAPANVTIGEIALKAGDRVNKDDKLLSFDTSELTIETEKTALTAESADENYQQSLYTSAKAEQDYAIAKANVDTYKLLIALQRNYINDINAAISGKTNNLAQSAQCIKDGIAKQINSKNDEITGKRKELNDLAKDNSGAVIDKSRSTQLNNEILDLQNETSKLSSSEAHVFYVVDTIAESRQLADAQSLLSDMQSYLSKDEAKMEAAEKAKLDAHAREKLKIDNQIQQISAESAQETLSKATEGIFADFNGIISDLTAISGSPVVKGGQLLTLQSVDDVMVSVPISKYNLSKVAIGQSADITIAGNTYHGTVTRINGIATKNESGTPVINAEVHIDDADQQIFLGIEAKVIIHTASSTNVLLAPVEAINTDNEGQFCYVIENDTLTRKNVVTGVSSDTMIEIKEGLKPDNQVVNDYTMTLTDGMAAKPLPVMTDNAEGGDAADTTDSTEAGTDSEEGTDTNDSSDSEDTTETDDTAADTSVSLSAGASTVTE
ncbi:MAG: efflux RND transporter periplasmic adaptor subunit [bacterium]|nr:efflux RND transporter periplasmic adaptor subunit [bacterium]